MTLSFYFKNKRSTSDFYVWNWKVVFIVFFLQQFPTPYGLLLMTTIVDFSVPNTITAVAVNFLINGILLYSVTPCFLESFKHQTLCVNYDIAMGPKGLKNLFIFVPVNLFK